MVYTFFNNEIINFYNKSKRIEERLKLIQFDDSLLGSNNSEINLEVEKEIIHKLFLKSMQDFWNEPDSENPLLEILNEIIDNLDDWERILINQRAKGLPYHEIATFIDKPENQLKIYYSRIISKIQIQLLNKMKENKNE